MSRSPGCYQSKIDCVGHGPLRLDRLRPSGQQNASAAITVDALCGGGAECPLRLEYKGIPPYTLNTVKANLQKIFSSPLVRTKKVGSQDGFCLDLNGGMTDVVILSSRSTFLLNVLY